MSTVDKKHHLLAFVALHHAEQKRKYTGEPYLRHLQNVARMADGRCDFGYEIGLCHDLLEDTTCDVAELISALIRFGYTEIQAAIIAFSVEELTDVYTHEDYPNLNRAARKKLEAERLHEISYASQTVKYCDILDNAIDILACDKRFGAIYINEVNAILAGMDKGNQVMYKRSLKLIASEKKKLHKTQKPQHFRGAEA